MNLIVCMKQVVDLQQIRIKRGTREPLLEGLPLVFGDMDKNALEEAVKIKEKHGGKVTAVALGSPKLKDTIIEALAIGADEAVILTDPSLKDVDTMLTAMVLARAIRKIGEYDLILVGEGSADNYSGQVGPRLAEALDLPQIAFVRELQIGEGKVRAVRNVEECFEVVEASLPALVTVTSEINKPRLPSLVEILSASSKPLHEWTAQELGIAPSQVNADARSVEMLSNLAQEQERKGIILEGEVDKGVSALVDFLAREGALGR